MSAQPVFLTREGYHSLEQELNHLSTVRRKELAEQFRHALPEGDMLENAGLQDAYDQYAFLEGRIQTLRNILSNVVIIEEVGPHDMVGLGSHVTVVDLAGDGTPETYRIVGSTEANPVYGRISNESPLGKQLMGRRVMEEVVVDAPEDRVVFRIVGIH
jgi:transcription elongation factor GreA